MYYRLRNHQATSKLSSKSQKCGFQSPFHFKLLLICILIAVYPYFCIKINRLLQTHLIYKIFKTNIFITN